LQYQTK